MKDKMIKQRNKELPSLMGQCMLHIAIHDENKTKLTVCRVQGKLKPELDEVSER